MSDRVVVVRANCLSIAQIEALRERGAAVGVEVAVEVSHDGSGALRGEPGAVALVQDVIRDVTEGR